MSEKFPGQMGSLEFFTALPDKKPDSQRKSKYRGPQLYWYDFQKRINFPFLHYRMVAGSEFSFVVLIGDSGFVFTAPRMRQDPNVVKLILEKDFDQFVDHGLWLANQLEKSDHLSDKIWCKNITWTKC